MTAGRRWLALTAVAYLVIIVAVVLGLVGLYSASRDRLDEAMGDRLLAVANSLAVTSDAPRIFAMTLGDSTVAGYIDSLSLGFQRIRRIEDLAEVTLNDPDGRILISTSSSLPAGKYNDFWELDRPTLDLARRGFPQVTGLYQLQQTFQKSAHVPVLLQDPVFGEPLVVAVVTVSGNPDFFDSLAKLKRGALVTGLVVLLVLIAMGAVLYRVNLAVERYRRSVLRQENLAAMGRMTAGIAHEIRNPLGIIRGAGQHLQEVLGRAGIDDPIAGFIPEEVDRLDQILAGYLAFGTDGEVAAEVFDLATVLGRSLDLVRGELEQSGSRILGPPPPPGLLVLGDPRRVQQVVLNLLLNARDAMLAQGGGAIEVALERHGNQAVLTCRDQGPGLGQVDVSKVFEPFWTSKEKGSGLGLAISKRIVEDMGGSLELRDRGGETGAEARVVLPISGDSSQHEGEQHRG